MLQNHRLPVPDPFAWGTYLGKLAYPGEEHARYFNLTHEWLAQIYLYTVYAAGGYPGMVLMRALLMTLVCAGVALMSWRRTGHFYLSLSAAFLLLGVQYRDPVSDRPLLLSLVLLVATEDFRNRRLLLIAAVSILATALNPNGVRALQVLLLYQQSALQAHLIVWTPPALWPPLEMFTLVLYAAGLLLLWARRKARPADWLLYLAFAIAAARASRNIVFLGIVGAHLFASQYAVIALLAAGAGWQLASGRALQLRAAEWRSPAGAATFLQQHHVTHHQLHRRRKELTAIAR